MLGGALVDLLAARGAIAWPRRHAAPCRRRRSRWRRSRGSRQPARIAPADAARYRQDVTRAVALIARVPAARAAPLALAARAGGGDRTEADGAARARGLRPARGERRLVRPPRAAGGADGHHRRRRRRLPLLRRRVRVPPARQLRGAERRRREQERRRRRPGSRTRSLARGVPEAERGTGWEYYFDYGGGRAPWLSGFAQAVAAQAFARAADGRHRRRGGPARGGPRRLPRAPGPPRPADRLRPVDQALQLQPRRRAQRPAPVGDLARRLREGTIRPRDAASAGREPDGPPRPARCRASAPATGRSTRCRATRRRRPLPGLRRRSSSQTLARSDDRFAAAAAEFASFRDAAAAVQARQRRRRRGHLLGLEALLGAASRRSAASAGFSVSRRLAHRRLGRCRRAPGSSRSRSTPPTGSGTARRSTRSRSSTSPSPPHAKKHKPKRNGRLGAVSRRRCRRSSSAPASTSPTQASLAAAAGLGAVRMTLLWPSGASTPDPGAVAALNRLPAGNEPRRSTLYASPAADRRRRPRGARRLRGRGRPAGADAARSRPRARARPGDGRAYESALAAVVRRGQGGRAVRARRRRARRLRRPRRRRWPRSRRRYRTSGRQGPLMDELAFTPAPGRRQERLDRSRACRRSSPRSAPASTAPGSPAPRCRCSSTGRSPPIPAVRALRATPRPRSARPGSTSRRRRPRTPRR